MTSSPSEKRASAIGGDGRPGLNTGRQGQVGGDVEAAVRFPAVAAVIAPPAVVLVNVLASLMRYVGVRAHLPAEDVLSPSTGRAKRLLARQQSKWRDLGTSAAAEFTAVDTGASSTCTYIPPHRKTRWKMIIRRSTLSAETPHEACGRGWRSNREYVTRSCLGSKYPTHHTPCCPRTFHTKSIAMPRETRSRT